MKKIISVEGMSCEHCVKHVSTALQELPGVTKVEVSLAAKNAVIEASTDISDEAIRNAIDDAGYELKGIEAV